MSKAEQSGLESPTLVLNKHWMPIDAVTAREALVSVIGEKAKIVCPNTYYLHDIYSWIDQDLRPESVVIQTARSQIMAPDVIVNTYDKIPKRTVVFSRRNLWRRDSFRCQYCGKKPSSDEITVDHVVPKSRGGQTTFANTVLACVECNKKKDNRTPEEAGMRLRKMVLKNGVLVPVYYDRPKRPQWSPMFSVRRQRLTEDKKRSWSKFIQDAVSELYWNTELEP